MRLFIGIAIPSEVTDRLNEMLTEMKTKVRLQWSPPANFHITVKFVGEWPNDKLNMIVDALCDVPTPKAFPLAIDGVGFYPNTHAPRVFWAGVQNKAALARLAHDTDHALNRAGVPLETRPYSPHITLARLKPNSSVAAIQDLILQNRSTHFGSIHVSAFHLYLSRTGPSGSVYEKLSSFPFQ